MNKKEQKEAFLSYEANAWFERNKNHMMNYSAEEDRIINVIRDYGIYPKNILEVGSSAGYRLHAMKKVFAAETVVGIEPSLDAIKYGTENYPSVDFIHGTIDDVQTLCDSSFDLIIVGFVFYVIDRRLLLKSISEIDRLLSDGGILIIIDFFTERAIMKNYHHIRDFSAYSFKQNYNEIFQSSQMYHLIDKSTYDHVNMNLDATGDFQDLVSITMLRKDINASYR